MIQLLLRRCGCCAIMGRAGSTTTTIEGYNGRLDAMQAGILQVKLAHFKTGTVNAGTGRPSTTVSFLSAKL